MNPPRRLMDWYLISYLRRKWQLPMSMGLGIIAYIAVKLLTSLHIFPAILIGWDVFTGLYLILAARHMVKADAEVILSYADLYDDGEFLVLLLSILTAILSMAAIIGILAPTPGRSDLVKALHVSLAVTTLVFSWLFIHTSFAFHYAHGFYVRPDHATKPPLLFPECATPSYRDFLYFAFVIGTSGQTADVAFASSDMRFKGMIHCVVAYVFNAAVLGLSINIAAGLIGGK